MLVNAIDGEADIVCARAIAIKTCAPAAAPVDNDVTPYAGGNNGADVEKRYCPSSVARVHLDE